MKEIIENYLILQGKLEQSFGSGYDFEICLDEYWKLNRDELWYGLEYRKGDDYELDYCPDTADGMSTYEGFTSFRIYDNGQKYRIIFDNKNKIEDDTSQ